MHDFVPLSSPLVLSKILIVFDEEQENDEEKNNELAAGSINDEP